MRPSKSPGRLGNTLLNSNVIREQLEARERLFSPFAVCSSDSIGRAIPEESSPIRTEFQRDRDRPIEWAEAESAQKIDEKQKNILNIWMEREGGVYINDQPHTMEQATTVVAPLYAASERALVISVRGDREVPYRYMDQLQTALVNAGVVRVVFATQLEQSMQRERR